MKTEEQNLSGFMIQPKRDCPHLQEQQAKGVAKWIVKDLEKHIFQLQCQQCKDTKQNWFCLECKKIFCSRYVKGHMAEHNASSAHPISLSLSDGSYWCYACESYIDSPVLRAPRKALSDAKIKQQQIQKEKKQKQKQNLNKQELQQLQKMVKHIQITQNTQKSITLPQILKGLKQKTYKKVVVLTGAGLSTAAGIPDFRSPGSGLYSKLQQYNLPYPQAIFEIQYFKKNPTAFLSLSKQLLVKQFQPTHGHKFIKKLDDEGLLLMNLTQNIDDLQIVAGLDPKKLIQAHGHSRSVHCITCKAEADVKVWKQFASKLEAMYCTCGGLIKPDIVFFGQQLPKQFFTGPQIVKSADLVIIIGTSLKVMPFAFLAELISDTAHVLLINRDNVLKKKDYQLWLDGDIEQNIKNIMKDLQWL